MARRLHQPRPERSPLADLFVDMELVHGPCGVSYEGELTSDEEREAEWRERRSRLLAEEEAAGRPLPWAFWAFDSPEEVDHGDAGEPS